jgi:hypothetical protein
MRRYAWPVRAREWFGLEDSEKATLQHGRWPRYYIELELTHGKDDELFHMSRAQMRPWSMAVCVCVDVRRRRRFSERVEVGADIYVVMRISHIQVQVGEPEPSYMVHAHLHRVMVLFYGHQQ